MKILFTESTESVVDSYQDDVSVKEVIGCVHICFSIATSHEEGSAMDPYHNRSGIVSRNLRHQHVDCRYISDIRNIV